jgi:hypothetical protein
VGALPEADDSLAKASAWISERVARRDFTI